MRYLTKQTKIEIKSRALAYRMAGRYITDKEYDKLMSDVPIQEIRYNKKNNTREVQEFYETLYQDVIRFVSEIKI